MKQNRWTSAMLGGGVLIILTVFILNSRQAQAIFTATGTSLTGDSNSTIDVTGTLGIGNTNTTSITIGQIGQGVTFPGNLILSGITGSTQCLQVNSSGQVGGTGSACGSGSTSPAGSNTQIQFNNSNVFGASANLTWISPALTIGNAGSATGQLVLAGGTSGSTTLQPAAAASGALTLPAATGTIPYYTGSPTSGNCVSWGSSGALSDAGSACGAGGIAVPGALYDLLYSNGSGALAVDTGRATYNASTGVLAAPSLTLTGTTPAATSWVAGTGNIPALPANSAGFVAPTTGGASYLIKLPGTAPSVAAVFTLAAAGTADNVNETLGSFTPIATTSTANAIGKTGSAGTFNTSLMPGQGANLGPANNYLVGFPSPSIRRFAFSQTPMSGGTTLSNFDLTPGVVGTASAIARTTTMPQMINYATAASSNSGAGIAGSSGYYVGNPEFGAAFTLPAAGDITNVIVWGGLSSAVAAILNTAFPATAIVGFRFLAGTDTAWQCYSSTDGSHHNQTASSYTVTAGVLYKMRVLIDSTAGSATWQMCSSADAGGAACVLQTVCGGPSTTDIPANTVSTSNIVYAISNGSVQNISVSYTYESQDY
jgi:hypothetical protein